MNKYFILIYGLLSQGDIITSEILLKTVYFRFNVCNAKPAKTSNIFLKKAFIPGLKSLHNAMINL